MANQWSVDELDVFGGTEELLVSTYRDDGTLRRFLPIWVVRTGDEVYVRTMIIRDTGWYGRARRTGLAHVRVPGVDTDVQVDAVGEIDPVTRASIDAAFLAKYGDVRSMVNDEAAASTLRFRPA